MKVIAFNGSARKDGNTAILINHVLDELKKEGIETELVQLAGKKIRGCTACYMCKKNKDKKDRKREMLEKTLGTTNTTELAGSSQQLHEELLALDFIPPAYLDILPDTVYEETVVLQDSELPDNANARRNNFAQQLLHERLVDLQYQN